MQEENNSAPFRPRAGLGQLLRGHHSHREAGIHEVAGKFLGGLNAGTEQGPEADFPGVGHARLDASEGLAPEEVWSVDSVPGLSSTLAIGERQAA